MNLREKAKFGMAELLPDELFAVEAALVVLAGAGKVVLATTGLVVLVAAGFVVFTAGAVAFADMFALGAVEVFCWTAAGGTSGSGWGGG